MKFFKQNKIKTKIKQEKKTLKKLQKNNDKVFPELKQENTINYY